MIGFITTLELISVPQLSRGETRDSSDVVQMDFPEQVEVQALVDYASATLNVNILYDETIKGKKVTLRSPESVPKDSLLDLVRVIAQTKGLTIVEADHPGWYRVVPLADLQRYTGSFREEQIAPPISPVRLVTQVFFVSSHNVERITETVKPFLTTPGGSVLPIGPNTHNRLKALLVVTDFESKVSQVTRLIELMDTDAAKPQVRMVRIKYADALNVASLVEKTLAEKSKQASAVGAGGLSVFGDSRLGLILLIGSEAEIQDAERLVEVFDVDIADDLVTRAYTPKHVTADRVRQLIEQFGFAQSLYGRENIRMAIDVDANILYTVAPEVVHSQIAEMVAELDRVPSTSSVSRQIRFYRPVNRKAEDIIATVNKLLGNTSAANRSSGNDDEARPQVALPSVIGVSGPGVHGVHDRGGTQPEIPKTGPGFAKQQAATQPADAGAPVTGRDVWMDYVLTADEHTNTIIAVANSDVHERIEQLVKELDRRRPQVLIETQLVVLTLDDSLALGFEFESHELNGHKSDYIVFSALGLSSVNPATGAQTLTPGVGFNGVVLSPDELSIVLHALASHANSRVVAAPKILAADNQTSSISSVSESPFTSVNASERFETTSFAGFAEAGTTLKVEPHLTEGDHVELKYSLTFSNFTGAASGGGTIPPPRSRNTITSVIEVPDGYTAVIGGLTIDSEGDSVSEVPLLGRIPGLGLLFQNTSMTKSTTRLYVFIRANILRDDQFEDLKFLTEADLERAGVGYPDCPESEPEWIR